MRDTAALLRLVGSACTVLGAVLVPDPVAAQSTYYPPPEALGGWRSLVTPGVEPSPWTKNAIRSTVAMDWDALEEAWKLAQPWGGALLVVRDGWIVGEWGDPQPISIGSCTKSLSSLAMQRLFELSAEGALPRAVAEDDPAWIHLPAGWSSGEPEKQAITLRHLTTMSSGLLPDDAPDETAAYKNRVLSLPVQDPPDTVWAYASAPVDLLSLVVEEVTGGTLASFFRGEIADPIGMGPVLWGSMGSSTLASAFCQVSARDMARVAWLLLNEGRWDDGSGPMQLVSASRVRGAVQPLPSLSQTSFAVPNNFTNDPFSHLRYGKLFWTTSLNTQQVPGSTSSDGYYMAGFGTNFCYVVPRYDLVVVRLGRFPRPWDDDLFVQMMDRVMGSLLDRVPHASASFAGQGCGPAGAPLLFSTPPVLGKALTIGFPNLTAGELAVLAYGTPLSSPTPLGNGCSLALSTTGWTLLQPGAKGITLPLPSSTKLSGLELAFQGVVVAPGGATSVTNAVRLELGY